MPTFLLRSAWLAALFLGIAAQALAGDPCPAALGFHAEAWVSPPPFGSSRDELPREIALALPASLARSDQATSDEHWVIAVALMHYLERQVPPVPAAVFATVTGSYFVAVDTSRVDPGRLSGAHWLVKLALAAGRDPMFPHRVGFDTKSLFANEGLAYYGRREDASLIALPWDSLRSPARMTPAGVHEWKHFLSELATHRARREAVRPLEAVTLVAGRRFSLGERELTITAVHADGRVTYENLESGRRRTVSKSDFLHLFVSDRHAQWREPIRLTLIDRSGRRGPLFGTSYQVRHLREEADNALSDARLELAAAEADIEALRLGLLRGTQAAVADFRRDRSAASQRLTSVERSVSAAGKFIRVAAETLGMASEGELVIERIGPDDWGNDRRILLPGEREIRFVSAALNWYLPRGRDWSRDPSHVRRVLGVQREHNERLRSIQRSYRSRLSALMRKLRALGAQSLVLDPPRTTLLPAEQATIAIPGPEGRTLHYDDIQALSRSRAPVDVTTEFDGEASTDRRVTIVGFDYYFGVVQLTYEHTDGGRSSFEPGEIVSIVPSR